MEKLLFTVKEAAEMLSVSVPSINRFIKAKALIPVKLHNRTLFGMEELKRFATEGYTPKKEKKQEEPEEPEEPMDEEAVKLMKDFNL